MKGTKTIGLLALVLAGPVFSTGVSAYRGDYSVAGPNCDEERHELTEAAFASFDYDGWYALMTEDGRHPRVVDVVTEENFEVFVQAHEEAEQGDAETAAKLRTELGLNNGNGTQDGTGHGKSMGEGNRMQHKNLEDSDGNHRGSGNGRWRV